MPKKPAPTTPNGQPIRGSAGPQILKDLGLTDLELAAFLPPDAPRWVRGVFWCQFEGPASLDEIAGHFASRYAVHRSDADLRFPAGGPAGGVPVRTVTLTPKGRYVSYVFLGMRGETYGEQGTWQLEATFRASGTDWGSNRAVYERFKALELPGLGARDLIERTE